MIEVVMKGGVGNCLFQYAAGRALALREGTGLLLDISGCETAGRAHESGVIRALRALKLEATFIRAGGRTRRLLEFLRLRERRVDFKEQHWGFDPAFDKLKSTTRLIGYFQSFRYWRTIESIIRREIAPRNLPMDDASLKMLDEIRNVNAVSLHVRRGDYLESDMHNVCGAPYFQQAIRRMEELVESPVYFVFSDDLPWCIENLERARLIPVDLAQSWYAPLVEMHLMSQCRHHIISNSTFSWWGAWLNTAQGKIVLAPDRWFNGEPMNTLALRDTLQPDWHRIAISNAADAAWA